MSVRVRLALASALMLFLELALIRWLGANIVHLSYFSNFVLLGSFLGIGLGFLRFGGQRHAAPAMPVYSLLALLGLIAFVSAYPVAIDRTSDQLIFFTSVNPTGPPIGLVLPAVFLAVAATMAGPGQLVAGCFAQLPRLEAYRLDLLGSLGGILSFTLLSFLDSPPLVWFTIVGVLFVALLGRPSAAVSVTLLVALIVMFVYPLRHDKGEFWSPYYKVNTQATADGNGGTAYNVNVNNIPHQRLTSAATRAKQEPFYLQTYSDIDRQAGNVLIVGAGTGTDVAIALQHGATHIDAVEIDPTLLRFGKQHNPDHAYSDPRVTTHNTDGRAFLERTNSKYNLIIFALPDSLTLVSGSSGLRLESYLFTKQSIDTARKHLAPGGAFSMYNFYREQWLVDRLAGTLASAFGHSPCLTETTSSTLAVMTAGLTAPDQHCQQVWVAPASFPKPATDDHPFLYLRTNDIPSLYRNALLFIVAVSLLAVGFVLAVNAFGARRRERLSEFRGQLGSLWSYKDLFFLGAAFLLLETKNVTGFALLFGTTWLVNSLVFAGVLLAVLAAVELTNRWRTPSLPIMYGLLLAALATAWLVPSGDLLSLPVVPRALASIVLAFLPIFAANVIFAKRFADTADAPTAFAANLLGAIVGGCLEYLSLVLGYRTLLVVAGVLYVAAFVLTPRFGTPGSAGSVVGGAEEQAEAARA